jgi:hypothetical protein
MNFNPSIFKVTTEEGQNQDDWNDEESIEDEEDIPSSVKA